MSLACLFNDAPQPTDPQIYEIVEPLPSKPLITLRQLAPSSRNTLWKGRPLAIDRVCAFPCATLSPHCRYRHSVAFVAEPGPEAAVVSQFVCFPAQPSPALVHAQTSVHPTGSRTQRLWRLCIPELCFLDRVARPLMCPVGRSSPTPLLRLQTITAANQPRSA